MNRVIAPAALILLILAAGLAVTVFTSLQARDPAHARAIASIWPMLILGGAATAIYLARAPELERSGWLGWWAAGWLAYVVHLGFGFMGIYGGSLDAALAGQGALTVSVNLALLVLWTASVAAGFVPDEPWWERALHAGATLAFAVAALPSSLVFADHPVSRLIGAGLAAAWVGVIYRRLTSRRRSFP